MRFSLPLGLVVYLEAMSDYSNNLDSSILKLKQPRHDGIGAQFFRIVSAYSIARRWKIRFQYDPIESIDGQIFGAPDCDLPRWNDYIASLIKFDELDYPGEYRHIRYKNQHPFIISPSIVLHKILSQKVIHMIDSPHITTNLFPHYLENLGIGARSRLDKLLSSETLNIAIHIRQGETALSQFSDRFVPLAHYENILQILLPVLERLNLSFNCTVVAEPNQDKLIHKTEPKLIESIRINPDNPRVKRCKGDYYQIINEYPSQVLTPLLASSEWKSSGSAWSDFQYLLSADILITSKSSFSYLAAVLNEKALVVYTDFWHPKLESWIKTSSLTDTSQLEKRLILKFIANEAQNKSGF